MIKGAHVLISTEHADALRSFFRDTLGLAAVSEGSWPVLELPPAELGIHDTEIAGHEGRTQLYLMCDDLDATITELQGGGVEFDGGKSDVGFAVQALIKLPNGQTMPLYQPRYPSVVDR